MVDPVEQHSHFPFAVGTCPQCARGVVIAGPQHSSPLPLSAPAWPRASTPPDTAARVAFSVHSDSTSGWSCRRALSTLCLESRPGRHAAEQSQLSCRSRRDSGPARPAFRPSASIVLPLPLSRRCCMCDWLVSELVSPGVSRHPTANRPSPGTGATSPPRPIRRRSATIGPFSTYRASLKDNRFNRRQG